MFACLDDPSVYVTLAKPKTFIECHKNLYQCGFLWVGIYVLYKNKVSQWPFLQHDQWLEITKVWNQWPSKNVGRYKTKQNWHTTINHKRASYMYMPSESYIWRKIYEWMICGHACQTSQIYRVYLSRNSGYKTTNIRQIEPALHISN